MKLPFVIQSRAYRAWIDGATEREAAYLTQRIKDLEKVIAQNTLVQEMQLRHIKTMGGIQDEFSIARETLANQQLGHGEAMDRLRREYAGDLQLAHTRYDEFVRDMLDKLLARAPSPAARSSSPQQEQLPPEIQSAIEEFSFGNPVVEQQLTAEAWRRVKRNEKHDEIAEKIRNGETPE